MISEAEFNELYRLLEDDLRLLGRLIIAHNKPVEEASIRGASVILRRWLVEDKLAILANAARAKPQFPCIDTSQVFDEISRQPSTEYFLTGGVWFDGRPFLGASSFSTPAPDQGSLLPLTTLQPTMLSFHGFKSQRRLFFKGHSFTCEQVIKYTANKLGGVHIDFRRQDDDAFSKLDEAASYMKFGGPIPAGQAQPSELYFELERTSSEILSGVHIEIIAAAASLIQIQFDGKPLMEVTRNKSLWSWLRSFVPSRLPPLYDQGKRLRPDIRPDSTE